MAVKLSDEINELLQDRESYKVLATVDKEGIPHVTYKGSIQVQDDGNLFFYEIIESSVTNKNLVYSIWFRKQIAINVVGKNKKSYQIKGIPVRAIISGKEFQKHYEYVRQKFGDIDLSTVWIIEPLEVIRQTFETRRKEEEEAHPLLRHVDRMVV